jgi:heme/copper-type cytochrome/quinol oxidase subunit 1
VTSYRSPTMPQAEDEVAALAELGRRVTQTKKLVLLPVVLLSIAVGFAAALLHVSGDLAFPRRLPDGSYLVNKATVLVVMLLGGSTVFVPGFLTYKLSVAATIARWRKTARERHRLDDDTIDSLANMFVPSKRSR